MDSIDNLLNEIKKEKKVEKAAVPTSAAAPKTAVAKAKTKVDVNVSPTASATDIAKEVSSLRDANTDQISKVGDFDFTTLIEEAKAVSDFENLAIGVYEALVVSGEMTTTAKGLKAFVLKMKVKNNPDISENKLWSKYYMLAGDRAAKNMKSLMTDFAKFNLTFTTEKELEVATEELKNLGLIKLIAKGSKGGGVWLHIEPFTVTA